ncbi:hypothetical protein ACHAXR_011767 [Thalassiosira sp. AJA248-18]
MRVLAVHLIFHVWPLASSLFAHGFAQTPSAIIESRSLMPKSVVFTLSVQNEGVAFCSPAPPEDDIDSNSLLSQAYTTLTVDQLRDLLRQNGAKVSGNKRDLVDRLGLLLDGNGRKNPSVAQLQNSTESTKLVNDEKHKLLDYYNHMTVKELKVLLHERGAKVSGNKGELVQRLIEICDDSHDLSQSPSKSLVDHETVRWSVLESSITFINEFNATNSQKPSKRKEDDIELPFLSGLMFVNKPSGWSTLPTKQQQDNPECPEYPCLSDSVKKWLYNNPKGRQRLKRALRDEQKLWVQILQSLSEDPKQQKKWRRKREKQLLKMSTFEPRPVHRLDIDTSGCVCIALTPYALRAANMMFESKSRCSFEDAQEQPAVSNSDREGVQKRYVALVKGTLGSSEKSPNTSCIVKHSIGKVWVDDHNEWACDISDNGTSAFIRQGQGDDSFVPGSLREAATSYRPVAWSSIQTENNDAVNVTRVELTPHTGRGHQLRLHMASRGHPIVGDYMHGADNQESAISMQVNRGRLCLHAYKLSMDAWVLSSDRSRDEFQKCRVDVESCPPF